MSTAFAFAQENAGLANLQLVPRRDDPISLYLSERLKEWLAKPGNTQARAAKLAGVSTAQISNLKDGSRGAGIKTIRGVSKVLGMTIAQVEAEAAKLEATRPRPAERTVELEQRYPNLVEAIALRRGKVLSVTLERIAGIALHWPNDRSVGEWIDDIDNLDRQLRREVKTGERADRELPDEDDAPPLGR